MSILNNRAATRKRSPQAGFGSLALWIGIWAIVISLISLYFGIDARYAADEAQRRMARNVELLQESRSRIEVLEAEIRESLNLAEQRLSDMSRTVEQNETRLRTNSMQLSSTRKVASELIEGLTSQKEAITELATRIPAIPAEVVTERTSRPAPPREPDTDSGDGSEVSATAPERTSAGNEPAPAAPSRTTYTVKSGDTLMDIARRKNLSVPDLLDANPEIDPNVIRVGQELILPE